jgi:hypothetical protein
MTALKELAKARRESNKAYEVAFRKEIRSLTPMKLEEFWEVIPFLATRVVSDNDVDSAMHNLMCNLVYQSYGKCPPSFDDLSSLVAWELVVRFLNKYEEVKSTLHKKCNDLRGLERGDDGYGDLMDSLPLAGKDIVEGLINDDIATYKQLEEAFTLKNDQPLKKFILDGENYITMKLEEALQSAYLSNIVALEGEEEEDRRETDPHVVITNKAHKEQSWGRTHGVMQVVVGPFDSHHDAEDYVKQNNGTAVKLFGGVVKK